MLGADLAAIGMAGVPAGLGLAAAIAGERVRARTRRARLNRALHELRRPLQALSLAAGTAASGGGLRGAAFVTRQTVDAALAALGDVDRAVNGGQSPPPRRLVPVAELLARAADRWLPSAAACGRRLSARGDVKGELVLGDRTRLEAAVDNLIANALEHGSGEVRVSAVRHGATARVTVADGGPAARGRSGAPARWGGRPGWIPSRDPRRGHGLRIVADIARDHGGRFLLLPAPDGTEAVLELPLAAAEAAHQVPAA